MSTEKEAEKLWCAMAGTRATGSGCISSLCAMWRWAGPDIAIPGVVLAKNSNALSEVESGGADVDIPEDWIFMPADNLGPAAWMEKYADAEARRQGYCGLAGKPVA